MSDSDPLKTYLDNSVSTTEQRSRTVYCLVAIRCPILSSEKIGFALRPGLFSPKEIKETAVVLDTTHGVSDIFVPDHRIGYESLEIAASILALTSNVHAGSGVIRLLEHDSMLLARRVQTIQAFSSNRFILGVGTGSPGLHPGQSVGAMLERLDELKKRFQEFPQRVKTPQIYAATLKAGIAKRAMGRVDGLLLNFCSPRHALSVIEAVKDQRDTNMSFACYLKIFYSSESDDAARTLMLQEFLNYDSSPQYHEMFVQDGTAKAISSLSENEEWRTSRVELPRELLAVSLANAKSEELVRYVKSFKQAGVTLPVLYPYFPNTEDSKFKIETVKGILKSL